MIYNTSVYIIDIYVKIVIVLPHLPYRLEGQIDDTAISPYIGR
jgi:hypothetical protein